MASRREEMLQMYRDGKTLQSIGDLHGLTRERVRQIMGVTRAEGGVTMAGKRRLARKDVQSLEKHGCLHHQLKDLRGYCRELAEEGIGRERQPIGAFIRQRTNAAKRGIAWEIKLWDWWQIWQASGKWEQRGRGSGYVMSRYGDEGPYRKDNVYIGLARDNNSQTKHKKSGLPMGVQKCKWGDGYVAQAMKGGKIHYLGVHPTSDVAELAYLMFVHSEPQKGSANSV
jgi:hypothetical protein